ncbi:MAG TPA: Fe-S cluster assembly protein SufD [Gammaproteobacteria bacterium]|nr:Fe-S cluster assembly protein SufD [Gammaproteobacteria bacterium]
MTLHAIQKEWLQQQNHDDLPEWLTAFREKQRAAFMQYGVPSRSNERWKYADLGMIAQQHFDLSANAADVSREQIESYRLEDAEAVMLVLVDGKYSPSLSDCELLPQGMIACSLREAIVEHEALVKRYFNENIDAKDFPFAALNSAIFADGIFIYVPEGRQLTQPLQLLSLSSGRENAMIVPHHMIIMGADSEAFMIHEYAGIDDGKYFMNAVTSIMTEANSRLNLIKLQHESDDALHMENVFVRQRKDSHVAIVHVTTGAVFSRDDVIVQLKEQGAECVANGFYHASRDGQYIDHHIDFKHAAPRTASGMLYKGIAENKSRAVFNGSLHVEKDAQKINAYQENHNLLLSGLAEVYSKPELEIYADDVKCRHGATTGQLDQDAMFYMRARGIDEQTARSILLRGFVEEVLQRITHSAIRNHVMKQVKFL